MTVFGGWQYQATTVEECGNYIVDIERLSSGRDNPRPEHHRLLHCPIEGVKILFYVLLASTRRCHLFQLGVLRQERLENLIGLNFQLSFPELPGQRFWRFVVAYLKNSGIDGEDYDLTVAIRPDFAGQLVAGFRSLGYVERELDFALRRDTAKWRRSITEW